jgi:hypothetical protein
MCQTYIQDGVNPLVQCQVPDILCVTRLCPTQNVGQDLVIVSVKVVLVWVPVVPAHLLLHGRVVRGFLGAGLRR